MMNIKKKIMVIFATGIMAFSASPFVLAATPAPANNTQQAEQVDTTKQDTANQNNTANQNTQAQIPAAGNVQTQTDNSTQVSNKKYLSKGWAVFWFIFTIIINAIISFWIGNRFYKLSKKDNHLSFEIRALRKDIEEKFVNNVGGFSEQEVDIKNLNESLALDDEGLKPTAKQPALNEVSAEEEARFRRWEEAQSKPRNERVKPKSVLKEEFDLIIIDTPPMGIGADATIVGRKVDGVLMVVRNNFVSKKSVKKVKDDLVRTGSKVVGVVLNRIEKHQSDYYDYYGYY